MTYITRKNENTRYGGKILAEGERQRHELDRWTEYAIRIDEGHD